MPSSLQLICTKQRGIWAVWELSKRKMLQWTPILVPRIFCRMESDLLPMFREAPGKTNLQIIRKSYSSPSSPQGVCWISWRQKKEANWTSPNSLTSLLRSVNSHWEKDPGFVIASVEFLQVWSQSEQRCPAEKQLLLVCSLSDSPHPSRVPVHVSSVLRAASDSLVQG